MQEITKIKSVDDYNKLFGLETLHPLVTIADLTKATLIPEYLHLNYEVYALFLKDTKCGDIRYGRNIYDYKEGTIVCFAPGQVSSIELLKNMEISAIGLLFHPDLIHGTALGREMKQYSFFSYESNEALHLSEREKKTIVECFNKINT